MTDIERRQIKKFCVIFVVLFVVVVIITALGSLA
jgi:hypothetical protein